MNIALGRARLLTLVGVFVLILAATLIVATPARGQQGEITVQQATGDVVISSVDLAGDDASVVITNTGTAAVELGGWWVCNAPNYFPLPGVSLGAGASITVHAGAGTDSATDIYANGSFGRLSGDGAGEVALYAGANFASADEIRAYVGWNGGSGRKSVAVAAGIWTDTDVTAAAGDTITFDGGADGAASYSVAAQADDGGGTDGGFAATLSGSAEIPAVASDSSGSFQLDVVDGGANFTLTLANVSNITQAHIHQGPADGNGPVVAFLFDPADPGASTSTSFYLSGSLGFDDLVGPLAGDWDGFEADLAAGSLYVNVHSVANPGGEIRGQIGAGAATPAALSVDVPAGTSLVGWLGAPTTSAAVLAANAALSGIWYLSATAGWVLDSETLPDAIRPQIDISLGSGLLVIAESATTISMPLS